MGFIKEEFHFQKEFPFILFETNASQVWVHCHDCLEINLILKGQGHYIIEGKTYDIHTGDIFLINNAQHHMAVHDEELSMLVLVFEPRFIWEEVNDFMSPFFYGSNSYTNQITVLHEKYKELNSCICSIRKEYEDALSGFPLYIKALLMMFLAVLNRSQMQSKDIRRLGETHGKSYDRMRPVIEYIHEHFAEALTLEDLAKTAMMNRTYLSAYFKEVMKISVFSYIEQVRISHAKMLLRTTKLSVLEISLYSGFQGISYFNRMFKKLTGNTPGNYRRGIQKKKYSASL